MADADHRVRIVELPAECKAVLRDATGADGQAAFVQERKRIWYLLDIGRAIAQIAMRVFVIVTFTAMIALAVAAIILDGFHWAAMVVIAVAVAVVWAMITGRARNPDREYSLLDTWAIYRHGWYAIGWFRVGDRVLIRNLREHAELTPPGARLALRAHYHKEDGTWSFPIPDKQSDILPEDIPGIVEKFPKAMVVFDLHVDGKFFSSSWTPVPAREAAVEIERLGIPWR